ncbi:Protein phosphatase PTC7-like protein fig [Erysiphe neolycopersici]|uniref:Protein phosphatase n=1 Tax=Erysiphe neolycopersici TaxID=212602 RepID=A0A420H9U9_9PEZI|nr:Protein phosphatase PTC7-like protein fig [Erysiphe neolycopersici]
MAFILHNRQRLKTLSGRNGHTFDRIISSTANYIAKDLHLTLPRESFRLLYTSAIASSLSSCETTPRPRQKFFYNIAASYVAKHNKFISDQNSCDFTKDNTDISYLKSLTRQQHQKLYTDNRLKTGQDAFFVSQVGQTQDVVMGVADGVGGWVEANVDPADFSHGLCYYMKYAASIYEKEEWGGSDLNARSLIRRGFDELCQDQSVKAGSSTACVAVVKDNGVLDVANLGDSGYILIRLNAIHSYSTPQTHDFNTPFQLAIIPPQDEYQSAIYGTPYLQDAPEKAGITAGNLEHGDVLIIGSDGLWDNLFNSDILKIVSQAMLRAQAWKYSSSEGFSVGKNLAATLSCPDRISRFKLESLHRSIVTKITAEAKAASMNKLRDGPFSQEVKRTYPNIDYSGGKIDDICVILAIVCEEGKY